MEMKVLAARKPEVSKNARNWTSVNMCILEAISACSFFIYLSNQPNSSIGRSGSPNFITDLPNRSLAAGCVPYVIRLSQKRNDPIHALFVCVR